MFNDYILGLLIGLATFFICLWLSIFAEFRNQDRIRKFLVIGGCIASGMAILISFISPFFFTNFALFEGSKFKDFGGIGDTLGGLMNPFIAIAAVIVTGLAFYTQYQANEQIREQFKEQQFEAQLYEMLRYHRENVEITQMRNPNHFGEKYYTGHKAMREIYRQFEELQDYVSEYLEHMVHKEVFKDEMAYLDEISLLLKHDIQPEVHKKITAINIAYLILFFGIDKEGKKGLFNKLERKYNVEHLNPLLNNLSDRIALWSIDDDQNHSKNGNRVIEKWRSLKGEKPARGRKIKFYGGHQYRLAHYFRHLFQTITYIDKNGNSYDRNYEYLMVVRAQLSSYEQKLLFINSVSDMGRPWELSVDKWSFEKLSMPIDQYLLCKCMITKFDLVRNIPDDLGFIKVSDVYKNLTFEGNAETSLRREINLVFDKGYY